MSLPKKIVALLALALAVLGLQAPAQAATARSLSFSVSPSSVFTSASVTYAGRLTNTPTGSTVRIERKSGSTWVLVRRTTTTNATGNYSIKLLAPSTGGSYVYRAKANAITGRAAATSASRTLTVYRKATATLTGPATVGSGQGAELSGTVSPFVAGTTVTLQKLSAGSWINAATAGVTSAGTFKATVNPGAPGTYSYRASVPGVGYIASTVSPTRTVTVSAATAPTVGPASLPAGARNVAYGPQQLTTDGGAGTWGRTGTLPPGLTFDANGLLSGTPTTAGVFNFTITFTSTATGLTGGRAYQVAVSDNLTITNTTLPDAPRAVPYSVQLTTSGGAGTWALAPNTTLPQGLSLSPAGVISGTPGVPGDYGIYPVFSETGTGRTAYKPLALKVTGAALAVTAPDQLPEATKGLPYTTTLTSNGGAGTWTILSSADQAGSLPAGLTATPATGVISGTPTVSGLYAIYALFTETSTGVQAYKTLSLNITTTPKITTTSVTDGTTGSAYSQQLAKTGSAGTWSQTKGLLPAGLTLNGAGLISGTPTEAGDFPITVKFTETSTSFSDTQPLLLHVSVPGAPVITTTTLPNGTANAPYSTILDGEGSGTWAVSAFGQLPPGLQINPTTGEIFGTPVKDLAEGDWYFQVVYTLNGVSNTKVLGIRVLPVPAG